MIVTIEIKSCNDCRYLTHTGAFTKGGSKPCCDHDQTCKERGFDCFKRVVKYHSVFEELIHRMIRIAYGIPDWCPLKRGAKY